VSLSRENRITDIRRALDLMLKELGPRAIDTVQFDPTRPPFDGIQSTTWLELSRSNYVDREQYFGGVNYRLTGKGWLAGIETVGELDDLKRRMAPVVSELKRKVKGRRNLAFEYLDILAVSANVSVDFAYNMIESDAIAKVLGRHGVRWEHPGKLIRIDEDFGLEPL